MTNSMPWFRLYSETLNDPKIIRVCLKTKLPKYAVVGAITSLLCIASDSPVRGKLMISEDDPLSLEEILYMCGMGDDEVIIALLGAGILVLEGDTYAFANWDKRQAPSESVERVRRYRERKKQESEQKGGVTVTVTETPLKRHGNVAETADIEEDIDIPPTPQNGGDGVQEIDPVGHILSYNGQSSPQLIEPDELEKHFGKYRDEILRAYQAEFEINPNQGKRGELLKLARAPNFSPERFEAYLHEYNANGGNPYEVVKIVNGYDIYHQSGDIRAAMNGKSPPGRSLPQETFIDPQTGEEYRW